MIKVEQARSCRQLTTVKLERQEIINSGVTTTMDMTVVGPELVNRGVTPRWTGLLRDRKKVTNRGETTVLAGLLRDRKLVVVVEYPRWAGWPVTSRKVMWEPDSWRVISWYLTLEIQMVGMCHSRVTGDGVGQP